jgi:ATP-binding cassette, subfamily B, bacterial
MIREPLDQLDQVAAKLLGLPRAPVGEGPPLHRVKALAQKVGVEARFTTPRREELPTFLRWALRRGPVLVLDSRGWVLGWERFSKISDGEVRGWCAGSESEALDPGIEILLEGLDDKRRQRAITGVSSLDDQALPAFAVVAFARARSVAPGIAWRLLLALGLSLSAVLALVGLWWSIGASAFAGGTEIGWVLAWTVLIAGRSMLGSATGWMRSVAFQQLAETWRRKIFESLLEPKVAGFDSGDLIGGLAEIDQIEESTHDGALAASFGVFEAIIAFWVISNGATPWLLALVFVAAHALMALFAWQLIQVTDAWSKSRVALTRSLLGRLGQHRRRLVFGDTDLERQREDDELAEYAETSGRADAIVARLTGWPARALLVFGIFALAPALWTGAGAQDVAISLGGIVLAAGACSRLGEGFSALAVARAARWRLYELLGRSKARDESVAPDQNFAPARPVEQLGLADGTLTRGLKCRNQEPTRSIVGERMNLDGVPAALLSRAQLEGRVESLLPAGAAVFSTSAAFNLLAGRAWPPTAADLEAARSLCVVLELQTLLDGPLGLSQLLGEAGRPLSDGEKSRLVLARALLRDPDFLLLDDPFSNLDRPLRDVVVSHLEQCAAGVPVYQPGPRVVI